MSKQILNKKNNFFFTATVVIAFAAILLFTATPRTWAQTARRILVIPFTINAAGDLGYLQRGISDMLTSRLEQGKDVTVVTVDHQPKSLTDLVGSENADYVITGSVTVLGGSVSTDAQVAGAPRPG